MIDASVALKWILAGEQDADKALALCEHVLANNIDMGAPDILIYEVTNVLLRKAKLSAGETEKALARLTATGIYIADLDAELIGGMVNAADTLGLTTYDAAYVALAIRHGSCLVTADEELASKCERQVTVQRLNVLT